MLKKIFRILKKLLIILFVLVLLLIIAVGLFVLTFDLNSYKGKAEEKLTQLLRHPVTIESMHTKLALVPTITINNFQIDNNDPFKNKEPLLFVKKMDAELELFSLINAQITLHKIDIDAAKINLYKDKDLDNWSIPNSDEATTGQSSQQEKRKKVVITQNKLRIDSIFLNTLNVSYNDTISQQNFAIQNIKISQFHTLDGEIIYNDQTFNISANTGTLFNLLNRLPNFPIDLKVKSRLGNASLNGKIGNFIKLSNIQATFSAQTDNLKKLGNFFNIPTDLVPEQPAEIKLQITGGVEKMEIKRLDIGINAKKDLIFSATGVGKNLLKDPAVNLDVKTQILSANLANLWGIQPMTVEGDIELSRSTFKTKKMAIDANRSDMRLAADIQKTKNDSYNISLALSSDFLNPHDFIKMSNGSTDKASTDGKNHATATQSTFTIPWDMLKTMRGALNLNIVHLQVGNWLVGHIGINTQATLNNGQLKAPFKITALDGKLTGELTGQATGQTLALSSTASRLNLNGIRTLQQDLQNVVLDAKANLNAKGATLPDLLNTLNGKVILQANQGQIINKWFTGLPKMLNLAKKKQNVAFSNTDNYIMLSCAAANMNIKNGVITGNNQFALETNTLDILAGGSVDLPQKTMDLVLQPALVDSDKANEILSFSKFIRITGPFDKPVPKVDTEQTSTALLQAGLNKLVPNMPTQTATAAKTSVCQQVLGKEALIELKPAQKKQTSTQPTKKVESAATTQPQSGKKQFQEQLLNTLFETLGAQ